jgi:Domain of unknown function (DUF4124)
MRISLLVCGLFFAVFPIAAADLYEWTDENGVIHVVDESRQIPPTYREKVKVFESQNSRTPPSPLPLSPSRTYPTHSQGRFAQKLALDLGLIKSRQEDAMGPLTGAGIRPASSWQVNDPLTPETIDEVIDSARRAADAQRLSLSADGVEAIVQQAAAAILPPPPPVQEQAREEPLPQQIIIYQTPSQIIEVERETVPVYVPVPVVPYYPRHHSPRHNSHPGNGPFAPSSPSGPHTERWYVPQTPTPSSPRGPHTSTPGPTHMPFGASHMPFGASHMPFGTGRHGTQGSFGR